MRPLPRGASSGEDGCPHMGAIPRAAALPSGRPTGWTRAPWTRPTPRASTRWRTGSSPGSSPTGAGGGATPAWSSATAASLLVDTLFDLRPHPPDARGHGPDHGGQPRSRTLVNTHANGDHCYGNQLVAGGASRSSTTEALGPRDGGAAAVAARRPDRRRPAALAPRRCVGARLRPLRLRGDRHPPARPHVLGAHDRRRRRPHRRADRGRPGPHRRRRDRLLPDSRVVFAGDILFIGGRRSCGPGRSATGSPPAS